MRQVAVIAGVLVLAAVLIGGGLLIVARDSAGPISLVTGLFFALGFFWLLLRIDVEQTLPF
jgi:hypothetical protein